MDVITLYTLGHGARPIGELLDMLKAHALTTLIDIRARPESRRHPQFSQDALRAMLKAEGVTYHWAGRQLGGLRPVRPDSAHRALPAALRGFADHMEGEEFAQGAVQLLRLAGKAPSAMLCAERDPAQCHRSLIADYLTLRGAHVVHLVAPGVEHIHTLHPAARRESHALVYDRVSGTLDL